MDIKMPLLDGLSAARIMFEEKLGAAVVLFDEHTANANLSTAQRKSV